MLNMSVFLFKVHYQEVHTLNSLLNWEIQFAANLGNSKKGLINIKNNEKRCFLWFHIRHLNLSRIHPERIRQADWRMVNDLDYVDT